MDQRGMSSLLGLAVICPHMYRYRGSRELPSETRGFPVQSLYVCVGGAPTDPQQGHLISNFQVTYLQPNQLTPALL